MYFVTAYNHAVRKGMEIFFLYRKVTPAQRRVLRKQEHQRTFGFFESLKEAQDAVGWAGDLISEENYYQYVVIEKSEPGEMHPISEQVAWYKWSKHQRKFVSIQQPNYLTNVCNLALG